MTEINATCSITKVTEHDPEAFIYYYLTEDVGIRATCQLYNASIIDDDSIEGVFRP